MIFKTGQPRIVDVLLVIGQSNAVGQYATFPGIPSGYTAEQPMFKIWDEGTVQDPVTGRFVPYHAGYNSGSYGYTSDNSPYSNYGLWGLELQYAIRYTTELKKPLYILKNCYGARPITAWDSPSGQLWVELVPALEGAIAHFESIGVTPRFTVKWLQGENDSNASAASTYEAKLVNLIARVRAINPTYLTDMVWSNLHIPSYTVYAFGPNVNTAMDDVATDYPGLVASFDFEDYMSPTATYPTYHDSSHYTPAGLLSLGDMFYDYDKDNGIIN